MFVWLSTKKRARRVENGRKLRRKCPECGATTDFYECVVERSVSAFSVVKLWDGESTAYACSACGEVTELGDTHEPELTAREQRELAEQRTRALEAAKREREQAATAKRQQVDDELAALKRKLGKP